MKYAMYHSFGINQDPLVRKWVNYPYLKFLLQKGAYHLAKETSKIFIRT